MGDRSARNYRRRKGLPTYRLVRYADDWVVLVAGTRAHAECLRDEVAELLRPMGLRLSEEKTKTAHIDEGFDFLGFRIQRHPKRGSGKRFRLHLPVEEGAHLYHGQGSQRDQGGDGSAVFCPIAPAHPDA